MTAEELLRGAFEALARADAEELARLAKAVAQAELPETAVERGRLLAQHRTLGRLLALTGRNLWLLRGQYREPCGYGGPRG